MRRMLLIMPFLVLASAPAGAGPLCAEKPYADELCPWFDEAMPGLEQPGLAAPVPRMRWSRDGYHPGSAAASVEDGIHVVVRLPWTGDRAALALDIGYEPDWQPDRGRSLVPETAIIRLAEREWRSGASEALPQRRDPHDWKMPASVELFRFRFKPELVDAMLAASDAAPQNYHELYAANARGVLRFEILFRDPAGGIVSSNEILDISNGDCEVNCQPVLSLAGFRDAFAGGGATRDGGEPRQ